MGIMASPCFPAVGNLLSSWVPPKERGILSAFVLGGVQVGRNFSNQCLTCTSSTIYDAIMTYSLEPHRVESGRFIIKHFS